MCPSVDSPRSSSRKRPLARPKKVEVEEGEVTSSDEEVNEAVAGADLTSMVSTPPLEAPAEEEAPAKEEADGAPYVCWTSSLKESVLVGAKETALATASLIELKELAISIPMQAVPPGHKHRKQVRPTPRSCGSTTPLCCAAKTCFHALPLPCPQTWIDAITATVDSMGAAPLKKTTPLRFSFAPLGGRKKTAPPAPNYKFGGAADTEPAESPGPSEAFESVAAPANEQKPGGAGDRARQRRRFDSPPRDPAPPETYDPFSLPAGGGQAEHGQAAPAATIQLPAAAPLPPPPPLPAPAPVPPVGRVGGLVHRVRPDGSGLIALDASATAPPSGATGPAVAKEVEEVIKVTLVCGTVAEVRLMLLKTENKKDDRLIFILRPSSHFPFSFLPAFLLLGVHGVPGGSR